MSDDIISQDGVAVNQDCAVFGGELPLAAVPVVDRPFGDDGGAQEIADQGGVKPASDPVPHIRAGRAGAPAAPVIEPVDRAEDEIVLVSATPPPVPRTESRADGAADLEDRLKAGARRVLGVRTTPAQAESHRLLADDFWPIAIYPAGVSLRGGRTTTGKEPIGKGWGIDRWDRARLDAAYRLHRGAGVAICLGPGRGPGGSHLIDVETDNEEGARALAEIMGPDAPETMGWSSTRGGHRLYVLDEAGYIRLTALIARHGTEKKGSPGVWHFPAAPGLELRLGGLKPDGTPKQVQSVCPPTVGTNGLPRVWRSPDRPIAWPEAATDRLAELGLTVEAERIAAEGSPRDRYPRRAADAPPPPPGAEGYYYHEIHHILAVACRIIRSAAPHTSHNTLRDMAYWLGGFCWYEVVSAEEMADELLAAAHDRRGADKVADSEELVWSGLDKGESEPLELAPPLAVVGGGRPIELGTIGKVIEAAVEEGRAIHVKARTGVGKTHQAIAVVVRHVRATRDGTALIFVPTRVLAAKARKIIGDLAPDLLRLVQVLDGESTGGGEDPDEPPTPAKAGSREIYKTTRIVIMCHEQLLRRGLSRYMRSNWPHLIEGWGGRKPPIIFIDELGPLLDSLLWDLPLATRSQTEAEEGGVDRHLRIDRCRVHARNGNCTDCTLHEIGVHRQTRRPFPTPEPTLWSVYRTGRGEDKRDGLKLPPDTYLTPAFADRLGFGAEGRLDPTTRAREVTSLDGKAVGRPEDREGLLPEIWKGLERRGGGGGLSALGRCDEEVRHILRFAHRIRLVESSPIDATTGEPIDPAVLAARLRILASKAERAPVHAEVIYPRHVCGVKILRLFDLAPLVLLAHALREHPRALIGLGADLDADQLELLEAAGIRLEVVCPELPEAELEGRQMDRVAIVIVGEREYTMRDGVLPTDPLLDRAGRRVLYFFARKADAIEFTKVAREQEEARKERYEDTATGWQVGWLNEDGLGTTVHGSRGSDGGAEMGVLAAYAHGGEGTGVDPAVKPVVVVVDMQFLRHVSLTNPAELTEEAARADRRRFGERLVVQITGRLNRGGGGGLGAVVLCGASLHGDTPEARRRVDEDIVAIAGAVMTHPSLAAGDGCRRPPVYAWFRTVGHASSALAPWLAGETDELKPPAASVEEDRGIAELMADPGFRRAWPAAGVGRRGWSEWSKAVSLSKLLDRLGRDWSRTKRKDVRDALRARYDAPGGGG